MYESPINLFYSDITARLEDETVKAVQSVGIEVEKDEIIKALNYDRAQYEKGWADRENEIVRCRDCRYLDIINKKPIFAICEKHAKLFYLWQEDTREHFCSWGVRKENEIEF